METGTIKYFMKLFDCHPPHLRLSPSHKYLIFSVDITGLMNDSFCSDEPQFNFDSIKESGMIKHEVPNANKAIAIESRESFDLNTFIRKTTSLFAVLERQKGDEKEAFLCGLQPTLFQMTTLNVCLEHSAPTSSLFIAL